jgi:hypothetical protein
MMMKEYELREALESAAADMHSYNPNPITWLNQLVYFLGQLEKQAMDVDPINRDRYREMISNLKDAIHNYQNSGSW